MRREPEHARRFVTENGRTPAGAARRYVYAALATALENDLRDRDGRIRGGLVPGDDLLAIREARKVIGELKRKAVK